MIPHILRYFSKTLKWYLVGLPRWADHYGPVCLPLKALALIGYSIKVTLNVERGGVLIVDTLKEALQSVQSLLAESLLFPHLSYAIPGFWFMLSPVSYAISSMWVARHAD